MTPKQAILASLLTTAGGTIWDLTRKDRKRPANVSRRKWHANRNRRAVKRYLNRLRGEPEDTPLISY